MQTPSDESYRLIPLTQGQFAKVDVEDFESLSQHKWFAIWNPHTQSFYAVRHDNSKPNRPFIQMHRVILGLKPGDRRKGDHADSGATLDNRRSNLRVASNEENGRNARRRRDNWSGFKGVHFRKNLGVWCARIGVNRRRIHLGHFQTAEEAAAAYRAAALRLHGSYACFK